MTKGEQRFVALGVIIFTVMLIASLLVWGFSQRRENVRLRHEFDFFIKSLGSTGLRATPPRTGAPTGESTPATPLPPGRRNDEVVIPKHPEVPDRVAQPITPGVTWPQSDADLIAALRRLLAPAANQPYLFADYQPNVEWWPEKKSLPSTGPEMQQILSDLLKDNDSVETFSLQQIGEFVRGPYAGSQALLLCDESGMGSPCVFFSRQRGTGRSVALPDYPFDDGDYLIDSTKMDSDSSYRFPEFEYPQDFKILPHLTLHRLGMSAGMYFTTDKAEMVVPQSAIGDIYYSVPGHYFLVRSKTGDPVSYTVDIPFTVNAATGGYYAIDTYQLSWWYGSSTQEYFSATPGGCGFVNSRSVEIGVEPNQLVQAGTAGNGDPIYEFSDLGAESLRKLYREWYVPFEGRKAPYEEFLSNHPLFFWQDQLGRLIRFTHGEYLPAVECGKPAIYLYPPTTRRVRVEVNPRGGFTHTEPPYGNGWDVVATPDGQLTNVATGKTYPYLWWDGRGGLYQTPEQSWVVPTADVEPFLRRTLAQLGLTPAETADFLEYWLPYFTLDYPYYRIGFHGTSVMDELAPLTVTPRPTTVIRILMDHAGLATREPENPPRVVTPRRRGFTVVEWGGVRR